MGFFPEDTLLLFNQRMNVEGLISLLLKQKPNGQYCNLKFPKTEDQLHLSVMLLK